MLRVNPSELIWTLINFFLLYFLLRRFLFEPVQTFMRERSEKIRVGFEKEKLSADSLAREKESAAQARLQIAARSQRTAEQLRREAEEELKRQIGEARAQDENSLRQMEAQKKAQYEQEQRAFEQAVPALAAALALRLIREGEA